MYVVISGMYVLVVWLFYGNYIEHLLVSRPEFTNEKKVILNKLRLFSYKATGLKIVMFKKETWSIDKKLNNYMRAYIVGVLNLVLTALFLLSM